MKTRLPIWKIPTQEHLAKYGHPNGWRIVHCERSWSERGGPHGASRNGPGPKRWWEVRRAYTRRQYAVETFRTLRDARTWCDENVREVI